MKCITLSPNAIKNLDYGTFMMVARPDGKSWSGTLDGSDANGFILKYGNIRTELTFARNPTASSLVIPRPKWNLASGTQRLIYGPSKTTLGLSKLGRASCRERVCQYV